MMDRRPGRRWLPTAVAAAAGIALGCGGPTSDEDVGSSHLAIQQGEQVGPDEFLAVGNLALDGQNAICTATLVGENVILTALHCFIRNSDCTPQLTSDARFIASDGTRYPIDFQNGRVYAPGQSFEQLTSSALSTPAQPPEPGMCAGGAFNASYLTGSTATEGWQRPSIDIAVLGISGSPNIPTAQMWLSPSGPVDSFMQGSFSYAGRLEDDSTNQLITSKYDFGGLLHVADLIDLCPGMASDVLPVLPFFARSFACSSTGGVPGLGEHGDSGGPLFVDDQGPKVAGVTKGASARNGMGPCPNGSRESCTQGAFYNMWASVPDHASFLTQALRWAEDDYDADTVLNDRDNCVAQYNPTQDNSNLDMEQELGAEELGDACDPAPVAQPVPGELSYDLDADLWERCTGDADMSDCVVRLERHEIDLVTHFWSADATATETARTGFRYCICRDDNGELIANKTICKEQKGCLVRNEEFPKPEGLDSTQGETRWLRPAVSNGRSWPEDGKDVTYEVGSRLVRQPRWHWEDDAPEWKAAGFWSDAVDPPPGFPAGPAIAGLMWAHNDSVEGISAHFDTAPAVCNTQPELCAFGNSYEFWQPFWPGYVCPKLPDRPEQIRSMSGVRAASQQAAAPRYFPEPSLVLSVPLASAPDTSTFLPFDRTMFGSRVADTGFAVPCQTINGNLLAEITLAREVQVTRIVDQAITTRLRELLLQPSDLLWVGPSEPLELRGAGRSPVAIGVSTLTGQVLKMIAPDGEGHLDALPLDILPAFAGATTAPAALGPTTYSRLLGQVVQLTGTDAEGPLDTVRFGGLLAPSTLRELYPAEDRPDSVTAATFSWADRKLWLVGSAPATKGGRHARDMYLFVIDVRTGHVEQRRQLQPSLSRFWLTTSDQSEAVLLAAVDDSPSYRIGVFEPGQSGNVGRAELSGVMPANGRVIGPPRVGGGHVLVPVGKPASRVQPNDPRNYHVAAEPLDEVRGRVRGKLFHGQP